MRIGIDLDEVLCATNQAMLDLHNSAYGTAYTLEDIVEYDLKRLYGYTREQMAAFLDTFFGTGKHLSAGPIAGAVECIGKLKEHELVVISARPEHTRNTTEEWLEKHFPKAFGHVLLIGDALGLGEMKRTKGDIAEELGLRCFVEDLLPNALDISRRGIPVVLLDRAWNREGELPNNVQRAETWHDALIHIERSRLS